MTWSSSGGAASWPAYTLPAGGVTFRANTDAGLVFVVGTLTAATNTNTALTTALPAAFRPLQSVQLVDTQNKVFLNIGTGGSVTLGGLAGTFAWRSFYFTTVIPG